MRRAVPLLLLAPLLASCGDSTGPDTPSMEDVSGVYQVCALTFTPEGDALTPVNIVTAAFETANQQVTQPRLAVDPDIGTFEVKYTPKGQFSDRELSGTYTLRGSTATLKFSSGSEVQPEKLLLPSTLPLTFQPDPKELSLASSSSYSVPRAEYARLKGVSETGLADRISGTVTARFSTTCN